MDALNLIGQGDIYQKPFEDICRVCRNYSRNFTKRPRGDKTSVLNKFSNGASKIEIRNLLSNIKEDIISHLGNTHGSSTHKEKIEGKSYAC
jgi:hypothetical protein